MEARTQIKAADTNNASAYCVIAFVALAIGWFVAFAGVCGPLAIFLGVQAYRKGEKEGGQAVIGLGLLLTLKMVFFILNNLWQAEMLSRHLPHSG
jgi:hypothetical protein